MIVSFFLVLRNGMESIFKIQIQVQLKRFNLYIFLVITVVKPEETDFSKLGQKKNGMWIHPMRCVFKGFQLDKCLPVDEQVFYKSELDP